MRILTIILLGLLLVCGPVHAEEYSSVTGVTGTAFVIRGTQSIPVEKGMFLQESDILKLEKDAVVDFAMNGLAGGRMIGPAEVRFQDSKTGSMKIDCEAGKLVLNIEKLPAKSSFKVQTPTAIAAVRGTQFLVDVDLSNIGNPDSSFVVRDGSVEVQLPGKPEVFVLNVNEAMDIPKDFVQPPAVRGAQGAELAILDQASTIRTCG